MAKIVELRAMSDEKIEEMLENGREEMFNLRFQHASARLDDVSRLRKVLREVAQLETVLHMRSLAVAAAQKQPEVSTALQNQEWYAHAHFDYEESGWMVTFTDTDDKEIVSTLVNLNKKKSTRRRR